MKHADDRPWRPVLDGAPAEQARQVLGDIATALEPFSSPDFPHASPTLARGDAGLCVLEAVLERVDPSRGHAERAVTLLGRAFEGVGARSLGPGLFPGYTGVAWAAQYLRGRVLPVDEDPAGDVDEALAEMLAAAPFPGEYELVHGLVGIGVYALERLPAPAARSLLEAVVAQLAARAEPVPGGTTLVSERRSAPGVRFVDFSMAHGVAGAVAFLAAAFREGVVAARPLLEELVSWLLAQRQPPDAETAFPPWCGLVPPQPVRSSRTAWCYGDMVLAVALLAAARSTGVVTWEVAALEVARGALRRPADRCGIEGAGLCHGAAGLGLISQRLFHATGEELFAEAAREWFGRALAMRQPGAGLAGFRTPEGLDGPALDDPSFLTGVAGLGLALVSALHPLEPTWDRVLLLQVPAAPARDVGPLAGTGSVLRVNSG